MEIRTITGPDDLYVEGVDGVRWDVTPVFQFASEMDALRTLQLLAEDLRSSREEIRHIMRYLRAASVSAYIGTTQDGPVSPEVIRRASDVSKRTHYLWVDMAKIIKTAADRGIELRLDHFSVVNGDLYLGGMDPDEWLDAMTSVEE